MSDFAREITCDQDMIDYLTHAYVVSEVYAKELVAKHQLGIQDGMRLGSFIWYVGDQISEAEELEPRELEEDED